MTRAAKRPPVRDDDGRTIHQPLIAEPMRHRPDGTDPARNYYGPTDQTLRQDLWGFQPETVDQWRARLDAADRELLEEVLAGRIETTDYEQRWLGFLSRGERSDVVVVTALLDRMFRAGVEAGIKQGVAKERARRKKYDQTKRAKGEQA